MAKRYVLSFAASLSHIPEFPERTAKRDIYIGPAEWDIEYRVWPNEASLQKTFEMQDKSPPSSKHWRPSVKKGMDNKGKIK